METDGISGRVSAIPARADAEGPRTGPQDHQGYSSAKPLPASPFRWRGALLFGCELRCDAGAGGEVASRKASAAMSAPTIPPIALIQKAWTKPDFAAFGS